jgi:hypothetical protein
MRPRAEIQGNYLATLCPPSDILSKAENILKTKALGCHFSPSKAENILKRGELLKGMECPNVDGKLSGRVEKMLPKPRSCLALCVV